LSIRSKVFAAFAALAVIAAPVAVGATAATAATPSCGTVCPDIFNLQYSTAEENSAAFVLDVFRQSEKVGAPVILYRSSNSDPAEDFTFSYEGTTHDFFLAGLVSASEALEYGGGAGATVNHHIPNYPAFELEYAPFGVDSGLCVGTGSTATSGVKVTLQPCGATSKSVWIVDEGDGTGPFYPAIAASQTNFSNPNVLTYPENSYPTDSPRPQLYVTNLATFSQGSPSTDGDQLWSTTFGELP
jgi:hypothetical protein